MPITVPNRPSSGAAVAMVPSVVRKRSSSCASGLLDRLLHDVARALQVAQPGGEHRAERRVTRQALDHLGRQALALVDAHHLVEQGGRDDLVRAQRDRALDDQGNGDDGSEEEEPDRPACGLDDGEQRPSLSLLWLLARTVSQGSGSGKFPRCSNGSNKPRAHQCGRATCSG
jgi:hypothetical protein